MFWKIIEKLRRVYGPIGKYAGQLIEAENSRKELPALRKEISQLEKKAVILETELEKEKLQTEAERNQRKQVEEERDFAQHLLHESYRRAGKYIGEAIQKGLMLIEDAESAVLTLSRDGDILAANYPACYLLGEIEKNLVGKNLVEMLAGSDKRYLCRKLSGEINARDSENQQKTKLEAKAIQYPKGAVLETKVHPLLTDKGDYFICYALLKEVPPETLRKKVRLGVRLTLRGAREETELHYQKNIKEELGFS